MFFVYILNSLKNNKNYVGRTLKNPQIRLNEHNSGSNKWTKENRPFKLVYFEKYYCLKDANQRELFLKSGQGRKLVKLIVKYYN